MMTPSPSACDLIINPVGHDADFLRLCLSDKAKIKLERVLENSIGPVQYANQLLKVQGKDVISWFMQSRKPAERTDATLIQAWVFDRLVTNAMLLRLVTARPNSAYGVKELSIPGTMFLLITNKSYVKHTRYSGIANYDHDANIFIHQNRRYIQVPLLSLLLRFVSSVGSIDQENWILHHPVWGVCLTKSLRRVKAFRMFLHVALMSHIVAPDDIEDIYGIDLGRVRDFMVDFVFMRVDKDADEEEVNHFLDKLDLYLNDPPVHFVVTFLIEGPYKTFTELHNEQHGDQYSKKIETKKESPKFITHSVKITPKVKP